MVVESGVTLLGLNMFVALHMCIEGDKVITANPSGSPDPKSILPVPIPLSAPETKVREIGCAKGFVHKIQLKPYAIPVQQKLRRLPFSVRQAVTEELQDLDKDIIERIDASSWLSPIVITQTRGGGKPCICVDLREPNKSIACDCHSLAHIDELLTNLRGAAIFSTIDLASAYHQMLLHPDSHDITAFITHEGLASAPSEFQKMMSTILSGLPGVQAYLDDIICYGSTQQDHDASLRRVLHALNEAGLKLNMQKCKFNQTSLSFLGHTIPKRDFSLTQTESAQWLRHPLHMTHAP